MNRLIADQAKAIDRAELSRIDVPVSLLWGRHDRMVPLAIAEAAASGFGWPLRVVDEAAHAPHIETPDRFVAALAALLDTEPVPNDEHS
jgi:pimeloyl-ACP methyl ester carboxylesterase